jgi:hypothetical protein
MALRTTTLRTQPQLRWWAALASYFASLRSNARRVRSERREPIRSHAFKDDPNFWLRSL